MAPKYVKEIVVQTSYHSYPFVPPEVKPETKYFCKKKNSAAIGTAIKIAPAKECDPLVTGIIDKVAARLRRSNALVSSKNRASKFAEWSHKGPQCLDGNHWFTRAKRFAKIRKCPASSSFADSSKSMGTVSKYPFINKVFIGIPPPI